jgi:hypothetical protein
MLTQVSIRWHAAHIDKGQPPVILADFLVFLGVGSGMDRQNLYHLMFVRGTRSVTLVSTRQLDEVRNWMNTYWSMDMSWAADWIPYVLPTDIGS